MRSKRNLRIRTNIDSNHGPGTLMDTGAQTASPHDPLRRSQQYWGQINQRTARQRKSDLLGGDFETVAKRCSA